MSNIYSLRSVALTFQISLNNQKSQIDDRGSNYRKLNVAVKIIRSPKDGLEGKCLSFFSRNSKAEQSTEV